MVRRAIKKNDKPPRRAEPPQKQSSATPQAAGPLAQLQHSIGNQALQRLIQSSYVQTKLKLSSPQDPLENEADAISDRVMRMASHDSDGSSKPIQAKASTSTPGTESTDELSRRDHEEEESQTVARKKRNSIPLAVRDDDEESKTTVRRDAAAPRMEGRTPANIPPSTSASIRQLQTGGEPLPAASRAFFEPRFNADFSGVRVHKDADAASTAGSINARAFTVGGHIGFGTGEYAPESNEGRRLLAHELTHVMQQDEGVATQNSGGSGLKDEISHTAQHSDNAVVHRQTDLDQVSIGPDYAKKLTDQQLEEDLSFLLQRRRTLKPSTTEYEVVVANLEVITEEAARRGHDSPAVQRDEVITYNNGTVEVVQVLAASLNKIVKNKYGLRNHDLTEGLVSDAVDQLGIIVNLIDSSRTLLAASASADTDTAMVMIQLARERAVAAAYGTELLRRHFALLQLAEMVRQYVVKLSLEYTFVIVSDASRTVDAALVNLQTLPGSPDSIKRIDQAIKKVEETFSGYSATVKSVVPEYSFEISVKALEADVAKPPPRTDPRPQSATESLVPDNKSVSTSLLETGSLVESLVGVVRELVKKNKAGGGKEEMLTGLIDKAVDELKRASGLIAPAQSTLQKANSATNPTDAIALYQDAATKASAARAAVDLVRMHIMILRLADTVVYHGFLVDIEFLFVTLHPYHNRVNNVLAKLEKPGADESVAAAEIKELTAEFYKFGETVRDIDKKSRKIQQSVAIAMALMDMVVSGYGLYSMMRPPAGVRTAPNTIPVPTTAIPPQQAPPVVNPRAVTAGQINIVFGKGNAGTVAAVDQMTGTLQRLTAQEATNLRNLYDVAANQGLTAVPNLATLRPSVRLFLSTRTNHPFYQARFGTALQHMTEDALTASGDQARYGLVFRRSATGGIPDVQMPLQPRQRAIFDWTTPRQVGKISKYNANDVDFLIEVVQPGP